MRALLQHCRLHRTRFRMVVEAEVVPATHALAVPHRQRHHHAFRLPKRVLYRPPLQPQGDNAAASASRALGQLSSSFAAPLTLIPPQFTVLFTGGNAESFSLAKVLRIFINDVDLPIANHSFVGMQTEFSVGIGANQILVGVHAVHGDVLVSGCPRGIYQVSFSPAPCSTPLWLTRM